ncbi:MAG: hypothetical protein EP310_04140 [Bacteroidetes bacterium]|nr:MAG: hypothetical protein EP310_04140 [Bacteroidota bacterium]
MNLIYKSSNLFTWLAIMLFSAVTIHAQSLNDFNTVTERKQHETVIVNRFQFNGYTNHWQNSYTEIYRAGNLFKMAVPNVQATIRQSKINVADDLGMPGLLVQEGFISRLSSGEYQKIENPSLKQLEDLIKTENVLVLTNPESESGKKLEEKAAQVFEWTAGLKSYQYNDPGLQIVKAFYLVSGERHLFVISSNSEEQTKKLIGLIDQTRELLARYRLEKGWFGAATLLKSVTCTPGHPIEVIGKGMNEGNSWFIFDGYMDFLAKKEIESWVNEVKLPVVANVGFSPIYGCSDYEGLQVQDMETSQAWIDYARKKGGYAFRPVYSPENDAFEFDGYIATEGNKEQIDNENVPFISKTGYLLDNAIPSMVLFVEKEKPLSNETIWDAIMNRRTVAVIDEAKMMGPAKFRNALGLLYLDNDFITGYFGDNLDIEAKTEGYNLVLNLKNYASTNKTGKIEIVTPSGLNISKGVDLNVSLLANETKQLIIPLAPTETVMGRANPVAVHFKGENITKSTVALLDLPPAISVHQLLYGHSPKINYPVTVHNYSDQTKFPVNVTVYQNDNLTKPLFQQTKNVEIQTSAFQQIHFDLEIKPGDYTVEVKALESAAKTQLGVGQAKGKNYLYEIDLNSDGINEYRMENDSVQVTLLRTGARVIEYIVKSKNDNVLFKAWPEKTYNHKRPFRNRGYYPYGGFEDFLGQASMETHKIYDAKIVKKDGDYVCVEMVADYYGNQIKKIFTLYDNSPLLEVQFELTFKNPEANVLGPQPILELGKTHGTEDVFTVPTMQGLKEYRMKPEKYYGQAIDAKEGWNAGYDTKEDITFVGAFPVAQPIFLHMWMNHPDNAEAPHYYVEFQPWTPITQKTTMYFTYYLWGSGGAWQNGVDELRKRNLISVR